MAVARFDEKLLKKASEELKKLYETWNQEHGTEVIPFSQGKVEWAPDIEGVQCCLFVKVPPSPQLSSRAKPAVQFSEVLTEMGFKSELNRVAASLNIDGEVFQPMFFSTNDPELIVKLQYQCEKALQKLRQPTQPIKQETNNNNTNASQNVTVAKPKEEEKSNSLTEKIDLLRAIVGDLIYWASQDNPNAINKMRKILKPGTAFFPLIGRVKYPRDIDKWQASVKAAKLYVAKSDPNSQAQVLCQAILAEKDQSTKLIAFQKQMTRKVETGEAPRPYAHTGL